MKFLPMYIGFLFDQGRLTLTLIVLRVQRKLLFIRLVWIELAVRLMLSVSLLLTAEYYINEYENEQAEFLREILLYIMHGTTIIGYMLIYFFFYRHKQDLIKRGLSESEKSMVNRDLLSLMILFLNYTLYSLLSIIDHPIRTKENGKTLSCV